MKTRSTIWPAGFRGRPMKTARKRAETAPAASGIPSAMVHEITVENIFARSTRRVPRGDEGAGEFLE